MARTEDILKHSKELKRKKRIGLVTMIIVGGLILIVALIFFFRLNYFQIANISVSGNKTIDANDLRSEIESSLAGNYLYFLPKRNLFLYPARKIADELTAKWPRLAQASLQFVDHDGINLTVRERLPRIIWCANGNDNHCYFADNTGYLYAESPKYSDNIFYSIYGTLPDSSLKARPLSIDRFKNLISFCELALSVLKSSNLADYRLSRIDVVAPGNYEASFKATGGDWKILFNDDSAETLAENLSSVLASGAFKKDWLAKKDRLEYLDLRYGRKVFYRFR